MHVSDLNRVYTSWAVRNQKRPYSNRLSDVPITIFIGSVFTTRTSGVNYLTEYLLVSYSETRSLARSVVSAALVYIEDPKAKSTASSSEFVVHFSPHIRSQRSCYFLILSAAIQRAASLPRASTSCSANNVCFQPLPATSASSPCQQPLLATSPGSGHMSFDLTFDRLSCGCSSHWLLPPAHKLSGCQCNQIICYAWTGKL